jgi:SRSO17 transposase
MEPIAARLDPEHTQACYASIQRLITDSVWDHHVLLGAIRDYCLPLITANGPLEAWIVDDTSFPKKGNHSVGVAPQHCGNLGKQANCQDAVSLSLAGPNAALPVAYRLYLPEVWASDPVRRELAGIPAEVGFEKKWEIAFRLTDQLLKEGVPKAPFLGDAGYGSVPAFRRGLSSRGFQYVLGIRGTDQVWPPGWTPLPAGTKPSAKGRRVAHLRQNPEIPALTVLELAMSLPREAWQEVSWREGTRGTMTSRFARLRGRPSQGCSSRKSHVVYAIPEEEWLLLEWPDGQPEPAKYWLSTMPEDLPIAKLVNLAKLRWRVEDNYEDLKQEVGLGDFEGRTWRGFHHHASLCIAAYAFLIAERTRLFPPTFRGTLRLPQSAVPNPHPWRRPSAKARTP